MHNHAHPLDPLNEYAPRLRSLRRWRLALSITALVLGIVLIAAGHLLVGVIIGVLAGARLVLFACFSAPSHHGLRLKPSDRQWLRAQAPAEFRVAANVLACEVSELRDQFVGGRSIAEVAGERRIDVAQLTAAVRDDIVAKAVEAQRVGVLTEDAAQRFRALAPRFAERFVHLRRRDTI